MTFQHETLIHSEDSEQDHPVGSFDVHLDVIVPSFEHVTNSNWTENITVIFDLSINTHINTAISFT